VGSRAEDVVVFRFLEDARRSAVEQEQRLLQFFRDGSNRKAVAGADIADDGIDIVALIEVAQFLHLLGRAAVLVDDDGLDLHAAEADFIIWSRPGTLVQFADDEFGSLAGRDAEALGCGTRQECDDADLEGLLCR